MSVTKIRPEHWFQLGAFLDMKSHADKEKGMDIKCANHEVGHLLEKALAEQGDGDGMDTMGRYLLMTSERFVLKPDEITMPAIVS